MIWIYDIDDISDYKRIIMNGYKKDEGKRGKSKLTMEPSIAQTIKEQDFEDGI